MTTERKSVSKSQAEEEVEVTETAPVERDTSLDADVDDILDEIDDVLETNAEEFVKSFIQKGGE